MVKFISRGCDYGAFGIIIDRWGVEVEDEKVVEQLRNSPDFNVFYFEVEKPDPWKQRSEKVAKKMAERRKYEVENPKNPPVVVEPISGIDSEEEMKLEVDAAEENSRLKMKEPEQEEDVQPAKKTPGRKPAAKKE